MLYDFVVSSGLPPLIGDIPRHIMTICAIVRLRAAGNAAIPDDIPPPRWKMNLDIGLPWGYASHVVIASVDNTMP